MDEKTQETLIHALQCAVDSIKTKHLADACIWLRVAANITEEVNDNALRPPFEPANDSLLRN
jgi:hypothetical protein